MVQSSIFKALDLTLDIKEEPNAHKR